jgi:hypothetical protein
MEERGFVDAGGRLTAAAIGSVFQPAPGREHEWEEHCRENPGDPICLLGSRADVRTEELFEVRTDFVSAVTEAGLADVQRGVSDMVSTMSGVAIGAGVGAAGLVSPDDPTADEIINHPTIGPRAREFAARILF